MPWHMEDGSPVASDERQANIDKLLRELRPDPRPDFHPGLRIAVSEGVERVICCAGPYFAMERWGVAGGITVPYRFGRATILSNVGAPVIVRAGSWVGQLGHAETFLLPAALGGIEVNGPADVLIGYVPDPEQNIRAPLAIAGYGPDLITRLCEGV